MKYKILLPSILLGAFVLIYLLRTTPSPLLSPLGLPTTPSPSTQSQKYVVLGFAPYWNLKKISPDSLSHLTHFAYFNLHLNGSGSLYTHVNRREQDPGYTNFNRLLNSSPYCTYFSPTLTTCPELMLTFMPENQDALTSILTSPINRARTVNTITSLLSQARATSVNVDFEPTFDITPTMRNHFTNFVKELRSALNNKELLTISIYPSAASRPRLWDMPQLAEYTDYFVVMAYDYTMPKSTKAGPNSPLRGSGDIFEHDIIKNIAEMSEQVPSNKLLLGIPFYGYEWTTLDASKYSPTDSRGSVASLERIQQLIDNKTLELLWDRDTLTPYGISTDSGRTTQIYFENATSLRLKLEFVRASNLGGVAFWALGYEGYNSWVWDTLDLL